MKVLICGSRTFDDKVAIFRRMVELTKQYGAENLTLIEGEAKGADRLSREVAEQLKWAEVIAVPADWDKYGRRAGFVRNSAMLTYKPDLVIAYKDKERSVGTNMMIDLATKADVEVEVHLLPVGENA